MLRHRSYDVNRLEEAVEFKKDSFEIKTNIGQQSVSGYKFGIWGVNKGGSEWVLTHIPTGFAMFRGPSMSVIKAAAEKMLTDIPELLVANDKDKILKHSVYLRELILQIRTNPQSLVPKSKARPRKLTQDYSAEFMKILKDEGLQNLGSRYGKAGVLWGIKGGARTIAVGRRDIMRNYYYVLFSNDDRRPDARWNNKDIEYQSKMTPERLKEWIAWVKAGRTTKEVIADARRKFWDSEGEDYQMGSANG